MRQNQNRTLCDCVGAIDWFWTLSNRSFVEAQRSQKRRMGLPAASETAAALYPGLLVAATAVLVAVSALRGKWGPSRKAPAVRRLVSVEVSMYLMTIFNIYGQAVYSVVQVSERYAAVLRQEPAHVSGLHRSWMSSFLGGRLQDRKDAQWHSFRDSLPLLAGVMLVWLSLAHVLRIASGAYPRELRAKTRAVFLFGMGLIVVGVLHEFDAVKVLALIAMNYVLCHVFVGYNDPKVAAAILWGFNLLVLYLNETYKGYSFVNIFGESTTTRMLDSRRGMMPWHHSFNFVTLRMISYDMDFLWSIRARKLKKKRDDESGSGLEESPFWNDDDDARIAEKYADSLKERPRVENFHPLEWYHQPTAYVAYLIYFPLYLAGPTMTFNCFISHLSLPQRSYSLHDKVIYALRFGADLLLFELMTHYMYVGAISYMAFRYEVPERNPANGNWVRTPILWYVTRTSFDGPINYMQVVWYSYWALMFLWFKFLLIWRFFRLWAVCDDVEPVENMERCMNNNFTVSSFWRSWHRSFNRWLLRYIYVPLGGNKVGALRKAINVTVVFTFVGFWHDLKPELFAWGWLFALFFVPEIIVERLTRFSSVSSFLSANPVLTGWILSTFGAFNIVMLKIANIIGYSTGLEGGFLLFESARTRDGAIFMLQYLLCMALGVQFMLFIQEMRDIKEVK